MIGHSRVENDKAIHRLEYIKDIKVDIAARYFNSKYQSRNINIEPQHIQYNDKLRISFTAFNQPIHLHLSPNIDIFHPNYQTNSDYLVFKGHSVQSNMSETLWSHQNLGIIHSDIETSENHLGWARIFVQNFK